MPVARSRASPGNEAMRGRGRAQSLARPGGSASTMSGRGGLGIAPGLGWNFLWHGWCPPSNTPFKHSPAYLSVMGRTSQQ